MLNGTPGQSLAKPCRLHTPYRCAAIFSVMIPLYMIIAWPEAMIEHLAFWSIMQNVLG
jgi:hypothetical protein